MAFVHHRNYSPSNLYNIELTSVIFRTKVDR
uniref:Uncharacterized protein n=1 Tax=Physcomitrium patens TaxID=3218 RepID=A0A2K1JL47_PHYPA|nr:hypothetical protein PHYPA_017117 [Physcomitrium patens]